MALSKLPSDDDPANEDFLLVAAMDFGTTFSGYAFSMRNDYKHVITNTKWTSGSRSLVSLKTPTCILLKPDKGFHSFGYAAENKFVELTEADIHRDWYFFKHFKMLLHNNQDLTRETTVEDITGKKLPALLIFKLSIKFLKDHLMTALQKSVPEIKQSDVRFVLTVPAIWDDTAKQFMREAAKEAGIDGDKLKVALEPEAASVCCQDLPMINIEDETNEIKLAIAKAGTQYMVVDIGGGTADITVHEKNIDGTLKEIYAASGGPWGGTAVDMNFLQLLSEILGTHIMEKFAKEETEDMLDLAREFEIKKRTLEPNTTAPVKFKVPASLKELYEEETGQTISEAVSSVGKSKSVKWLGDKLILDADAAKRLFNGPINSILNHVVSLFKKPLLSNVSIMILVGGFSECSLVQEQMFKTFPMKRIIVPPECGLAVLRGAVIFGHKPKFVKTRIARFTYGIEIMQPFDPLKHPGEYKIILRDEEYCDHCFEVFVEKGQEIPLGHEVSKRLEPILDSQRNVNASLYVSTSRKPRYTTDAECRCLGTLKVPLADGRTKEEKGIEDSMIFGDTELMLKSTQIKTGKTFQTYFDLQ